MSVITSVERHGPQAPGEYWWMARDASGTMVGSFWTEERNPQELIELANEVLADDLAALVDDVSTDGMA